MKIQAVLALIIGVVVGLIAGVYGEHIYIIRSGWSAVDSHGNWDHSKVPARLIERSTTTGDISGIQLKRPFSSTYDTVHVYSRGADMENLRPYLANSALR